MKNTIKTKKAWSKPKIKTLSFKHTYEGTSPGGTEGAYSYTWS